MMKKQKRKNDFRHLSSYKDIKAEKMHLAYRVRYTEKQLEVRLLEIGYFLHPVRLIPSLVTEWAQPMLYELKSRVQDYLFGRGKRRKNKRGDKKENNQDS